VEFLLKGSEPLYCACALTDHTLHWHDNTVALRRYLPALPLQTTVVGERGTIKRLFFGPTLRDFDALIIENYTIDGAIPFHVIPYSAREDGKDSSRLQKVVFSSCRLVNLSNFPKSVSTVFIEECNARTLSFPSPLGKIVDDGVPLSGLSGCSTVKITRTTVREIDRLGTLPRLSFRRCVTTIDISTLSSVAKLTVTHVRRVWNWKAYRGTGSLKFGPVPAGDKKQFLWTENLSHLKKVQLLAVPVNQINLSHLLHVPEVQLEYRLTEETFSMDWEAEVKPFLSDRMDLGLVTVLSLPMDSDFSLNASSSTKWISSLRAIVSTIKKNFRNLPVVATPGWINHLKSRDISLQRGGDIRMESNHGALSLSQDEIQQIVEDAKKGETNITYNWCPASRYDEIIKKRSIEDVSLCWIQSSLTRIFFRYGERKERVQAIILFVDSKGIIDWDFAQRILGQNATSDEQARCEIFPRYIWYKKGRYLHHSIWVFEMNYSPSPSPTITPTATITPCVSPTFQMHQNDAWYSGPAEISGYQIVWYSK
jgi:hypothetical protein